MKKIIINFVYAVLVLFLMVSCIIMARPIHVDDTYDLHADFNEKDSEIVVSFGWINSYESIVDCSFSRKGSYGGGIYYLTVLAKYVKSLETINDTGKCSEGLIGSVDGKVVIRLPIDDGHLMSNYLCITDGKNSRVIKINKPK